jgi:uncharacterized protein
MRISLLPGAYAIARLAPGAPLPGWTRGAFVSITRTAEELSIVCEDEAVPDGVRVDRGWRLLQVEGPIPFEMTGVAASLVGPLGAARISVNLIATFDTDYLMVKRETLDAAMAALQGAGHDLS